MNACTRRGGGTDPYILDESNILCPISVFVFPPYSVHVRDGKARVTVRQRYLFCSGDTKLSHRS